MKRRVLLICIGVCFLGVIAAALGFGAESKRIKESEINFYAPGKCTYPRTPAFALGLTAFLVLIVAHAIINASAGCNCCNKLSSAWVSFCAVFSWLMFGLASILLLAGSVLNDRHTVDDMYSVDFCYEVLRPWIFAKGAILGLISVTFGVLYYLTISSIKDTIQMGTPVNVDNHGSILMTQPQVPAQMNLQPVFVPEDTYNRRQLV
ncbi:hypothetical protein MKX01_003277 [Papaver californicum]|nr:hypothetical protein MKX01_003277 [Papaver californicum]